MNKIIVEVSVGELLD